MRPVRTRQVSLQETSHHWFWVLASTVGITLLVPATVLGLAGDCLDQNGNPKPFTRTLNHIRLQGMNACPSPYPCALIGAPAGCPQQCAYRDALSAARGSYCQASHSNSCLQCVGDFVCEEFGIYEDPQCQKYCSSQNAACRSGLRTQQGLCRP